MTATMHPGAARLLAIAALVTLTTAGGCGASAPAAADPPYRLPASGSVAEVWCQSPMHKVFPTDQPPERRGEEIVLWAARGESEPAQIVVRPARALAQARVRFEDLVGPGRLAAENLTANFVGWVNVDRTRWHGNRTGPTPDPLLPNEPTDLAPGASQPIWITVTVPREIAPGEYSGGLWIEGKGMSLPVRLRLHVFDFALPRQPSLSTLVRLWGVPRKERPVWWDNLARHRITGEAYPGPLQVGFSGEAPALDFAAFDAAVGRYAEAFGLELGHVPQISLGNAAGFLDPKREWAGRPVFSRRFDAMFQGYCAAMADHLRAKGWLRWTHFQFWDEPKPGEMTSHCKRLAQLVRAAAPDARIYLTAAPMPELHGLVDIWCVPLIRGYPAQACAERRKAGDEIWAYDNRLYSLDVDSSSMDLRGFPWRLFGADIVGVEWWAINKWRSDPYREPNQYPPQNGGGFFLYPPSPSAAGASPGDQGLVGPSQPQSGGQPVNSIRWEMVREGIEDHDYLALLVTAMDAACSRLGVSDPALSGGARAKALCARVAPDVERATTDPRVLAATRMQIAREILFHQGEPDVVFAVQGGEGRRRIVGRTAVGTQIRIGGAQLSVGDDGAFRWTAESRTRSVELEASAGRARKTLTVPL